VKKLALALAGVLLLSGCAEMVAQQQAETQKSYNELTECQMPNLRNADDNVNKQSFISNLTLHAYTSSADNFVMETKFRRLQIVGWDDSVTKSIGDCYSNQIAARIDFVKKQFETLKSSTKNKDEKMALIAAYSAWEAYVTSQTEDHKQDFESKLSFYKNI